VPETKPRSDLIAWLFPRLERRYEPLVGMAGYHYLDHVAWIDAFDQTAMIVGGMGPYSEPKTFGGKLFAGIFALYSGLLLIGLTVFILTPIFHRVMHSFHLPGGE
jgi:hypothetical protein